MPKGIYKRTEEVKKKCINNLGDYVKKGLYIGEKNPWYGHHHSKESILKNRLKHFGKKLSVVHKIKISLSGKGKKHKSCNEECKNKRRINALEQFKNGMPEETKKKLSFAKKGKKRPPFSEEWKRKLREKRLKQVIPTRDTLIEVVLQKELKDREIIFETHKPILGQPDLFIQPNICIFADGDYYHNLERQKVRDIHVTNELQKKGYLVLRYWGYEIESNFEGCIDEIVDVLCLTDNNQFGG